ncbi:MAG: hypothetical protein ACT4QD_05595 [Acidobacteriota bacterium]
MTRLLCAASTALVLLVPTAGNPQPTPDFSGTWTLDESRSASATHEGFVGPVTWRIRQDPDQLVVDVTRGPRSFTLTYRIFNAPPKSPPGVPSYRSHWDGDRLVNETVQNIQGQTVTTRELLKLAGSGGELVVERVVEVEHGYTLRRGQNYSTAIDTFVKKTP